ncbi:lytic transglycosylase domain-containing protein [Pseudorhodoferax sp.]|uniref:lytic transglycosylase domain-containing protein n=1 Tax=Pseudorhodoferax sp. TaxID=1993553 RepID=UPI0039E4EDDE
MPTDRFFAPLPAPCLATLATLAALAACALASPRAHGDVFALDAAGRLQVVAADPRPAGPAPAGPGAVPAPLREALHASAARHRLSPALLEALVWQESRWQPGARSAKGAIGLAQLMPETARELGVDPHDPVSNLEGGARYLRRQLDRYADLRLALAAYNAGPAAVDAAGGVPAFAETRGFVDQVLGRLAASTPSSAAPAWPSSPSSSLSSPQP